MLMPTVRRFSDSGTRWTVDDPEALALRIRLNAVHMVAGQGSGYLGQALSAAEQVAAVFTVARPGTDRLVCSPGHYVIAPYAAAVALGLLDRSALSAYGANGSVVDAIGGERSPVVDLTCGSLGQGLSAATGYALADRMRGRDSHTFTLVSDGEMEEGQVWEAAMFAAHHRLSRLTVLLDASNSQVDGPVDSVTTIEPLAAKWASFGWWTTDVDGHDPAAILTALDAARTQDAHPSVIICRTSTTHGLDSLPPGTDGHVVTLSAETAARAVAELTRALEDIDA
ncbi:transketolase [Streptomyces sp. NPDC056716]|uniref:transketolase n=1 Tax=unclassified Streptomyces TaxID=2593676 RepID=UPI003676458A